MLTRLAAALVAVLALICGCSSGPGSSFDSSGDPAGPLLVRVGSANFSENRLLAEIYAIGLQSRGISVERRFSAGPREVYYPALLDGSLDLVPEYTGNLLLFLDPTATDTRADDVADELTDQLPDSLRLLDRSRAQDADTVVVTAAYANQNQIDSLDKLAAQCPNIAFGGPAEFQTRPYGTPGLAKTYNCTFGEFRPLDAGGPQTVAALNKGTVQAADLFSSDPAINQNGFVTLADPKANFPDESVVPLINSDKAEDPRVDEVLNLISQRLDTNALVNLNRQLADPSRPDQTQVAHDWLASVHIIN